MRLMLAFAAVLSLAVSPLRAQTPGPVPAEASAKAYFVNEITVTDPAVYADYVRQAPALIGSFGGRYLVRAGALTPIIGEPPTARIVIVEFPSHEAAVAFWESPAYRAILPIRQASSTSRAYIVDGVAP